MMDISVTQSGPALASTPRVKINSEAWHCFLTSRHASHKQTIHQGLFIPHKWGQKQYQEYRGKVISMTGGNRVNARGFGLNTSQTRCKEKLKILPSSTLLKQNADAGRLGFCTFTGDLLLLLTRNCAGVRSESALVP